MLGEKEKKKREKTLENQRKERKSKGSMERRNKV